MQHASLSNTALHRGLLAAATLAFAAHTLSAQPSLRQLLLSRASTAYQTTAPEALAAASPTTTEEALHALAQQADIIFAGEVVAIHHDAGAVRVEWNVLQGLLGVQAGQNFVLREWAGLWSNDDARYRVGQRSLVLLHAASAGGFRSPVGGQDGILPLNGDPSTGTTDLRWIAIRATRPNLAVTAGAAGDQRPLKPAEAAFATPAVPTSNRPAANTQNTDPGLHAVDANMVMGLLNAWCRRSAK